MQRKHIQRCHATLDAVTVVTGFSPAVGFRSISFLLLLHSSAVRSGSQCFILCNIFISNSSNKLPEGKRGRVNGKCFKRGSLCKYLLLLPPIGLEFLSSRNSER